MFYLQIVGYKTLRKEIVNNSHIANFPIFAIFFKRLPKAKKLEKIFCISTLYVEIF